MKNWRWWWVFILDLALCGISIMLILSNIAQGRRFWTAASFVLLCWYGWDTINMWSKRPQKESQ